MELLIPGLILVALMVWASTKIKNRAAAAFEAEVIETETYRLSKPEGFLHVIGDDEHELRAYSKDFGSDDDAHHRQATIELDVIRESDVAAVSESVTGSADQSAVRTRDGNTLVIETDESANETRFKGFYKLVASGSDVYRLRILVLAKHVDDYLRRIDGTIDSFTVDTH